MNHHALIGMITSMILLVIVVFDIKIFFKMNGTNKHSGWFTRSSIRVLLGLIALCGMFYSFTSVI